MSIHLGRLRRTATLRAAGAELAEAAKASGVFWKNEREFLRQARAWELGPLGEIQPELLAADRACQDHRLPRPPDRRTPGPDDCRQGEAAGAVSSSQATPPYVCALTGVGCDGGPLASFAATALQS